MREIIVEVEHASVLMSSVLMSSVVIGKAERGNS